MPTKYIKKCRQTKTTYIVLITIINEVCIQKAIHKLLKYAALRRLIDSIKTNWIEYVQTYMKLFT